MLATLDNGVTIREEIAFTKSGRGIELLTQVTNGGDEAIETDARIRVDLSAAGNRSPRIRRETEEGWARTALRPGSGGSLTVAVGERTRVQLRKQHIAVTSDAAAEGGTLRFRRNGESIRHEYSLGEDPIAPGETQRAGVRLEIAGSGPRGRQ